MKSNFEEQLSEALRKRDATNTHEPLPGHEERFEMRLLKMKGEKGPKRLPTWTMIAAAACIAALIVAIVVKETRKTNSIANTTRLSDVSSEMAAVEMYYHQRLQFDKRNVNTNDKTIKRFMDDIRKLEEEYAILETNLSRNFSNERIAKAMVNNYKFRLQLMEQLQKYIEIQNQINNQNNEQKLSS